MSGNPISSSPLAISKPLRFAQLVLKKKQQEWKFIFEGGVVDQIHCEAPTRTKELFLPQRITHYQEIDSVIDSWQHDLSTMWQKKIKRYDY